MAVRDHTPPLGFICALVLVSGLFNLPAFDRPVLEKQSDPLVSAATQAVPKFASVTAPDRTVAIAAFEKRPLFAPGRRSPVAVAEPVMAAAPAAPIDADNLQEVPADPKPSAPANIRLVGSMTMGDVSQALIHDDSDGKDHWIKVGADIQGWTLIAITRSSATLQAQDNKITVELFDWSPN